MTRYCLNCDDGPVLVRDRRDVTHTHKGRLITIPAVSGWHCPICGEIEFEDGDGQRYSDAVQALSAQVRADEAAYIRAARKRLHMTQKEVADLFGGGPNAFSLYERGLTQPSKSTVLLLKLLDKHPELLEEIRTEALYA